MTRLLEILGPAPAAPAPGALADRYRGAMLGVAVGNALGIPAEGYPPSLIQRRFPQGLREIAPEEARLPWDDDLAQTVLIAEAIVETDSCDVEDLARRLQTWRTESGRGIGHLTRRVLDAHAADVPVKDAARIEWEEAGRNAAGNGAVMRCLPVALRWRRDPGQLVRQSHQSALVTHHDPRCGWSVVAMNVAIAATLEDRGLDLPGLAEALDEAGAPIHVGHAIRACEGAALADLDLGHDNSMGYTLKAMQAGLWALQQPGGPEAVLIEVVHAGGDTDTNGAVAGAALGAKHGLVAWPSRWIGRIRDRERLVVLADQLLERSGPPA